MEATIVEIKQADDAPYVKVVLMVRKNTYRATKPEEKYYVYPWMMGDSEEAKKTLETAMANYEKALRGYEIGEACRRAQNNALDALRLGDCSLLQDPFHPEEPKP